MAKGKAFLVVGHEDWGKSTTLKALTDNSRYPRQWKIGSIEFFIRRMSNDDQLDSFKKFVSKLDLDLVPYLIATLCPTFNNEEALPDLLEILSTLKRKYELFFFVLRHNCQNPAITISDDEISKLERYGVMESFVSEGAKSQVIARTFETFVKKHVN